MKKFFSWLNTFVLGYFASIGVITVLVIILHLVAFIITWDYQFVHTNFIRIFFNDVVNTLKWMNGIGLFFGVFLMTIRLES